ncbi:hypothetical protein ACOMCU_01505 [Lysinibacillus sp. UGB7]|uniref:hypothetical protein n=1 Tax=Lysinibacillus sp. UGB7 TaxID=3411039 RepID=UPI003B7DFD39
MLTTVEVNKTFFEEKIEQVEKFNLSKKQALVADYMVDQEYTIELVALVNLYKRKFEKVYRGARFKAEEIYEGNYISLGDSLVSTTLEEKVAIPFAFNDVDDAIMEAYAAELDDEELEDLVNELYSYCVFEIEEIEGLYLNDFFDDANKYTYEKEVLSDQEGLVYKILKVEPFSKEYPQINRVIIRNILKDD